jgi:hypothetical protein
MEKHGLDFCVGLVKKYDVSLADVVLKHGEIFEHLSDNFKDMPSYWYSMETERRTKQYFKEQYSVVKA